MTANAELDGAAAAASADLLSSAAIAVGTVPTPEQRRREDDLLAAALARGALLRSEGYFDPPPTKPAHGEPGPESPPAISVRVAPSIFSFDNDLSESSSLKSSVVDHVYENGMRYHGFRAGKYPFPNDDVEQNRDDMKHTMAQMLCHDAYFYSPIEDALEAGGEVLDLGTLVPLPAAHPAAAELQRPTWPVNRPGKGFCNQQRARTAPAAFVSPRIGGLTSRYTSQVPGRVFGLLGVSGLQLSIVPGLVPPSRAAASFAARPVPPPQTRSR